MTRKPALLIATGILIGISITVPAIAAVGSSGIKRNAVLSRHIKNGQVKSTDLASGAVIGSRIASNAVTGSRIQDGSVAANDLAAGSVTGSKLGTPTGAIVTTAAFPVGQSIPDTTVTVLDLTASEYDSGSMISLGDDTLTVDSAGVYQICLELSWDANGTGVRELQLFGNDELLVGVDNNAVSSGGTIQNHCTTRLLTAGEALQVKGYQNSGGALSLFSSRVSAMRIGASS